MIQSSVKSLLALTAPLENALVQGWVKTRRDSKTFSFLEINDGSCQRNFQVIVDATCPGYETIKSVLTGTAVSIEGAVVASQGKGQSWEMHASRFCIVGSCPETFPLQKKGHTVEFLREIPHLRARTNRFGAMFRVRSRLAFAVHNFFQSRGFHYVHTPLITTSDCEGAGELFRVTTLPLENLPKTESGAIDYSQDFFNKQAFLTVSGQLEAETLACALGKVYTFGPTFRAENSHTSRHASEFWMIEPEMAFTDLSGDIDVAEAFVKYLVNDIVENCPDELAFFDKFVSKGLLERLRHVLERPFVRVSYTEAIGILQKSGEKFEFPPVWGEALQSEHERYLTERHFQSPVAVYDYPKDAKPFYMRQNDDGKTVAAADLLVPGIGEIIGGSQREERLERLLDAMKKAGLDLETYNAYIDLRRFGSVPHAGFGLGFERMLMFVTGEGNIRDVIPFPRTPGSAK
ncbi:MAG: asparagine--tRNA ligase [Opitutales bacterium]|nr:asparagine--tRNA ligase [Opitutales bacterium]